MRATSLVHWDEAFCAAQRIGAVAGRDSVRVGLFLHMGPRCAAALDQGTTSYAAASCSTNGAMLAIGPARACAALPAARMGGARCDGDPRQRARGDRGGAGQGCARAAGHRGAGHHQPARDHRWSVEPGTPARRCIVRWSGRTPGRADGGGNYDDRGRPAIAAVRSPGYRWPPTSAGPKLRWLLDHVAGRARPRRAWRAAVRHRWTAGWRGISRADRPVECMSRT